MSRARAGGDLVCLSVLSAHDSGEHPREALSNSAQAKFIDCPNQVFVFV